MRPFCRLAVTLVACALTWSCVEKPSAPSNESTDLEALRGLGYVAASPVSEDDAGLSGVVRYERGQAFDGLNLYASLMHQKVILLDMDGHELNVWQHDLYPQGRWQFAELLPDGDLLAIVVRKGLLRLDWDSNLVWDVKDAFHHDVAIRDNGDIYAIVRDVGPAERKGKPLRMVRDQVVLLSADGVETGRVDLQPIYESVADETIGRLMDGYLKAKRRLARLKKEGKEEQAKKLAWAEKPLDISHTNTIEWIDRDVPGFAEKGNVLVCARNLDLIAVIDLDSSEVVWHWGAGEVHRPHQPTLLDNGHLLIFDNGWGTGFSRVIELDPLTREIVWQFVGDPPESFLSRVRGSNERLPNGNTLITQSSTGYVFELDPEGRKVWEFYAPIVEGEPVRRENIYRMSRIIDADTIARVQAR